MKSGENSRRLAALFITGVLLGSASASAATVFGITTTNQLLQFNSATPGSVTTTGISGLNGGTTLLGIDFRPATGQLFGLSSDSRLYTINISTGAATLVGASGAFTLAGTQFGFDFNPTVDRIRVVSNTGQNLRLNPNDGTLTATDTALSYATGDPNVAVTPMATASAYTNSFAGAATTTLYGIDSNLDILVTQNPPNNGTLNTVGPLGINVTGVNGFDILATGNQAFAALQIGTGTSSLYTINLTTGAATPVGAIGTGLVVTGLAVTDVPEPASLALAGAGLLGIWLMRRRHAA